ncbi:MAG TPA: N-acetyltransferase [Mariniphaga anaerophila]|uniref:N-acetyltransferase n=1 Tax=Mariniphaga anaerophila TaxID=1484053 RepID=A0A831LJH7_9BACT|nr:N-acetyltransferase [Mariniphaga anaerophila]
MLTGEKILLRPLNFYDVEKFYKWRNDLHVKKLAMMHPFPVTMESEKEWVESISKKKDNQLVVFSICEKETGNCIGFVKLFNINWVHRYCYFGIVIGEDSARGKGYGYEALTLISHYAFNILNINKITLEVIKINEDAIKLYKNFGFIEEGELKRQFYFDGKWHAVLIMSLFKKTNE